jgi:hypothetical protein
MVVDSIRRREIMTYHFHRDWLIKKFSEIQSRLLLAIDQLNDQLNWTPNEASLSIATLIKHMEGNIQERVAKGILHMDISRDREQELTNTCVSKKVVVKTVQESFQFMIETIKELSDEQWEAKQIVRKKERSNLDMLHQCAAHYSEHMGQIFYVAKQILQDNYKSTSV